MPMYKAAFSDLHDARFREIFDDKYKGFDTYYEKVFKMVESDGSYEQYSSVSGHNIMRPKDEGDTVATDARIQGYDIQFVNQTFALEAEISYENLKDDRFNVLEKEAERLAKAAKRSPDVYAADAFKRGFLGTDSYGNTQLAADGKRFFSTLHYKNPDETGTTYSNASSTGIVLTDDNLETALLEINQQKDARGLLAGVQARILLVPPALRKVALQITGSDKRAGVADNDVNVYNSYESYYGGKLNVVVWPELGSAAVNGSDTAWFLIDPEVAELMFQWREKPTIWPVEFNKKTAMYEYTCFARWEFGMVDWRGTWGSKGDGQAYSS